MPLIPFNDPRPPSADEWGDPEQEIPGYPVVDDPKPGDVVAAGGHVGVVTEPPGKAGSEPSDPSKPEDSKDGKGGKTTSATKEDVKNNGWPNRNKDKAPPVYRRPT